MVKNINKTDRTLAISIKKHTCEWHQKYGIMENLPNLSPWSYKLNTYNSTNDTQPADKHIWEICTSKYLKVGQSYETGMWKQREDQRQALKNTTWNSLPNIAEWEIRGSFLAPWSPGQSCLSDQHFHAVEPSDEGGEQDRDWVRKYNTCVLETAKQKVESQGLAISPHHPRVHPTHSPLYAPGVSAKPERNLQQPEHKHTLQPTPGMGQR